MALGFYFTPSSFTPETYEETISRLEEAGAGNPPGRLFHVALETDEGKIQVFDIFPFKPDDAPSGRRAARATLAPDKQVDVLLGKERAVDLRGAGFAVATEAG